METSAKWFLAITGLLLFLPDHEKSQRLSDLRKRQSRKLFYVSDGKVIPRSEIDTAKRMTRAGYGKVYAVWAYNANEARDYIQKGKGEVVSGLDGDYDTKEKLESRFDIVDEVLNQHDNQIDLVKYVVDRKTGMIEAKVDFSVYRGKAYIDWIEVSEDLQRQGIGRQLVKALKAEYPKIQWGYTTPQGTALKKAVKRLGGLNAFDLKTAPLWELNPSLYLSKMGIHEPWIAEIAPTQYARMSKRAKAEYDHKRDLEWRDSIAGKAEWGDKLWKAYTNGEFSLNDPHVTEDAKDYVNRLKRIHENVAKQNAKDEFAKSITIKDFSQLKPGDRVWSILTRDYYTVDKVYQKSVRLKSENLYKPFGKGEPVPSILTTKYPNALRELSPEDEETAFKNILSTQTVIPEKPKPKFIPEEKGQMTLFGGLSGKFEIPDELIKAVDDMIDKYREGNKGTKLFNQLLMQAATSALDETSDYHDIEDRKDALDNLKMIVNLNKKIEQKNYVVDEIEYSELSFIADTIIEGIQGDYLTQDKPVGWVSAFLNKFTITREKPPEPKSQMKLFGSPDAYKKDDIVELVHRYGNVPVGRRGIVTKAWINPVNNMQWVKVFYGKNLTGQRLQQSYPVNVLIKIEEKQRGNLPRKAKAFPEQAYFTKPTQMTLFGIHR